jgi:hypothetical protein
MKTNLTDRTVMLQSLQQFEVMFVLVRKDQTTDSVDLGEVVFLLLSLNSYQMH